ncbi:MAG: histidinol-phosphate transaminase [Candidatus Krumholzibacteria bacterium]|nr:histidinol-phosphate transaminase [Candidatus Krumholzibacteria bacterium]
MPVSEREKVTGMIKLSHNENPYGASPLALKAIKDHYRSVYRYPDAVHRTLKEKLARKHDVSVENITIGSGAVGVVDLVIKALVHADENVVTAEKTFVAYGFLAAINCRICKRASMVENTISLDSMRAQCDDKTKVVLIANPNNPTGTIVSHGAVGEFLKAMPPHIVVVVDEAYAEYVTDGSYPNSLELQKTFDNLVILRSFSKIYGLAGLRIGYGIGHRDIMKTLEKSYTLFSVNRLAAVAALAALDDTEFVTKCARANDEQRSLLYGELKGMGFNVTPSQGNFVMVEFSASSERDRIFNALKNNGIRVQSLGPFGVDNGLRISVGRPEENKQLLECLRGAG